MEWDSSAFILESPRAFCKGKEPGETLECIIFLTEFAVVRMFDRVSSLRAESGLSSPGITTDLLATYISSLNLEEMAGSEKRLCGIISLLNSLSSPNSTHPKPPVIFSKSSVRLGSDKARFSFLIYWMTMDRSLSLGLPCFTSLLQAALTHQWGKIRI